MWKAGSLTINCSVCLCLIDESIIVHCILDRKCCYMYVCSYDHEFIKITSAKMCCCLFVSRLNIHTIENEMPFWQILFSASLNTLFCYIHLTSATAKLSPEYTAVTTSPISNQSGAITLQHIVWYIPLSNFSMTNYDHKYCTKVGW